MEEMSDKRTYIFGHISASFPRLKYEGAADGSLPERYRSPNLWLSLHAEERIMWLLDPSMVEFVGSWAIRAASNVGFNIIVSYVCADMFPSSAVQDHAVCVCLYLRV